MKQAAADLTVTRSRFGQGLSHADPWYPAQVFEVGGGADSECARLVAAVEALGLLAALESIPVDTRS